MAVLRFVHALHLRLSGLGLLAIAGLYFFVRLQGAAGLPAVETWVPATLGIIGAVFLLPWILPRGLRRPAQGRDLVWLAVHAVVALVLPRMQAFILAALPAVAEVPPEALAIAQQPVDPVWWVVPPFVLMLLLVLPSFRRDPRADHPDGNAPAHAAQIEEKKRVRLPEKKLPALGAAMKLYVVADGLILRLLGLGLMATAYMIWTMIDTGRLFQAQILSHGKPPMTAVYVYGGVGALLALPVLLPRRIARPSHVFFGLVKALLLVVAAYVLIQPLNTAIIEFTPDIYHATLIETVPRLFKAICGVAVTAALLIAFFRQLNGLPPVDYKGDPKVQLSQAQLHDLRKARMPG